MNLVALDNLVRIGQLKAEPRNVLEVNRLLAMAQTRLADAHLSRLSMCRLSTRRWWCRWTVLATLRARPGGWGATGRLPPTFWTGD